MVEAPQPTLTNPVTFTIGLHCYLNELKEPVHFVLSNITMHVAQGGIVCFNKKQVSDNPHCETMDITLGENLHHAMRAMQDQGMRITVVKNTVASARN